MVIAMAEATLEQQVRRGEGQEYLASEDIVGKRVKNPEGYDLGEISSLRVGLPTGRVAYAVLRTGGMFGLGAKHFAIPLEAIVYRPGDDVFVVNISKYRLDNEPGFTEGEWPKEANWNLIETRRPVGPPSQEEARAVTRTEPPFREVVTTERVEVREKASREEKPIKAEEVEKTGTAAEARTEETRPTVETKTAGATVVEERSETRTRAPAHLSAADLQVYLKGMDYPAGRQDLIDRARKNNAPESVIATFEGFGDRTYRSPAEVSEEFGSKTHGERRETAVERPPETRTRAPVHLSAADLQSYLRGMDYPAGRQDLVARAKENGAPESVINVIEEFGDRTYRSAAEVSEEFGKIR